MIESNCILERVGDSYVNFFEILGRWAIDKSRQKDLGANLPDEFLKDLTSIWGKTLKIAQKTKKLVNFRITGS